MMRANTRAWAVLSIPRKYRRSSTAALVGGTDRSSLGLGHAEHGWGAWGLGAGPASGYSPQRAATRACAAQYGPRPTAGLPHRVNGRFSPSGHWQPRVIGRGGGAAAAGGGFSGGGRRGGMSHYAATSRGWDTRRNFYAPQSRSAVRHPGC